MPGTRDGGVPRRSIMVTIFYMCRASSIEKEFLKKILFSVWPIILLAAFPAWSQTSLKKQPTKTQVPSVRAAKAYTEATELLAQSKPELAARKYQEAATHWQALGDRVGEAKALRGLAESLQFGCDSQESVKAYERSLSLSHAAADAEGERQSLANLCFLHAAHGDNDRALDECTRSFDLATKAN